MLGFDNFQQFYDVLVADLLQNIVFVSDIPELSLSPAPTHKLMAYLLPMYLRATSVLSLRSLPFLTSPKEPRPI